MVDDNLGRRLVPSLILCRTVYEAHGCPVPDKFSNAPHKPEYKSMSDALKAMFQTNGLHPFPFLKQLEGTSQSCDDIFVVDSLLTDTILDYTLQILFHKLQILLHKLCR